MEIETDEVQQLTKDLSGSLLIFNFTQKTCYFIHEIEKNSYIIQQRNNKTSVLSVVLAYSIIVTLGVSKGREIFLVILLFHLAVLHLLLNKGLKEIPVDRVKALRDTESIKTRGNNKLENKPPT